jgi:hypothetical protein
MAYHYENNELTDMGNVIRMQLRRPESTQSDFRPGKTPSWATSVINVVQRRNRQGRTQNFIKQ